MERISLLGRRLFVFLGLAVIIFLVMDFNNRMADLARFNAHYQRESESLAALTVTSVALETQIAYAGSDDAVEDDVREDGRYILPGDYPVIPLTSIGYEPPPPIDETPSFEILSYWQVWLRLFFGSQP